MFGNRAADESQSEALAHQGVPQDPGVAAGIVNGVVTGAYGHRLRELPSIEAEYRSDVAAGLVAYIESACEESEQIQLADDVEGWVSRSLTIQDALLAMHRLDADDAMLARSINALVQAEDGGVLTYDALADEFFAVVLGGADELIDWAAAVRCFSNPLQKKVSYDKYREVFDRLRQQPPELLEQPICSALDSAEARFPSDDEVVRAFDLLLLGGELGLASLIPYARRYLELRSEAPALFELGMRTLGVLGDCESAPRIYSLFQALDSSERATYMVQRLYYEVLGQLGYTPVLDDIKRTMPMPREGVEAYARLAPEEFVSRAEEFLRSDELSATPFYTEAIIRAFSPETGRELIPPLVTLLVDPVDPIDGRLAANALTHLKWPYGEDRTGALYLSFRDLDIPGGALEFMAREIVGDPAPFLNEKIDRTLHTLIEAGTFITFYAGFLLANLLAKTRHFGNPFLSDEVASSEYQVKVAATIEKTDRALLLTASKKLGPKVTLTEHYYQELVNDDPMPLTRRRSIDTSLIHSALSAAIKSGSNRGF